MGRDGGSSPFPPEDLELDIAARFEGQAHRQPDWPAVVSASGTVTYGELRSSTPTG